MDAAELAYHQARQGTIARFLVWVSGRNRSTDAIEQTGFWTGDDDASFVIDGQSRDYFGANQIMTLDPIVSEIGLGVRMWTVTLATTPAVEQAVRGYDPSLQPIEVHRAVFNLDTGNLVTNPERIFYGTVDETPIESAKGEFGSIKLVCAPITRALTRTVALHKSDAALRERSASDGFRKYTADARSWDIPWGQWTNK